MLCMYMVAFLSISRIPFQHHDVSWFILSPLLQAFCFNNCGSSNASPGSDWSWYVLLKNPNEWYLLSIFSHPLDSCLFVTYWFILWQYSLSLGTNMQSIRKLFLRLVDMCHIQYYSYFNMLDAFHICIWWLRTYCCRFIISGWLLVVITFVLCGVFVILNK